MCIGPHSIGEWVSEWVSEWASKQVSELVSKYFTCRVYSEILFVVSHYTTIIFESCHCGPCHFGLKVQWFTGVMGKSIPCILLRWYLIYAIISLTLFESNIQWIIATKPVSVELIQYSIKTDWDCRRYAQVHEPLRYGHDPSEVTSDANYHDMTPDRSSSGRPEVILS